MLDIPQPFRVYSVHREIRWSAIQRALDRQEGLSERVTEANDGLRLSEKAAGAQRLPKKVACEYSALYYKCTNVPAMRARSSRSTSLS